MFFLSKGEKVGPRKIPAKASATARGHKVYDRESLEGRDRALESAANVFSAGLPDFLCVFWNFSRAKMTKRSAGSGRVRLGVLETADE